jgi:hypothetical protein
MTNKISVEEFMKLARKPRTAPPCNTDFTLTIQYTTTVQDCANPSNSEVQTMMNGLIRAWHAVADPMCTNKDCPQATITNFQQTSTQCVKDNAGNNVWTVTANITGQCKKV